MFKYTSFNTYWEFTHVYWKVIKSSPQIVHKTVMVSLQKHQAPGKSKQQRKKGQTSIAGMKRKKNSDKNVLAGTSTLEIGTTDPGMSNTCVQGYKLRWNLLWTTLYFTFLKKWVYSQVGTHCNRQSTKYLYPYHWPQFPPPVPQIRHNGVHSLSGLQFLIYLLVRHYLEKVLLC